MFEDLDVGTEAREEPAFFVAGLRLPRCPLFTREGAARTLMLRPRPTDVILSSYPTCDTPLVDLALSRLLHPDLSHPPPCLEMVGGGEEHSQNPPRLYKTYFPLRLIPFYRQARYVYVIRCPWDVCTDYYRFLGEAGALDEPFDAFFERFLEGDVPYGSFFRHVAPWNKRLSESNVLVLCREHVEHNPRSALFKIAAFLGDPYLRKLMDDSELESNVLGELSNIQPSRCISGKTLTVPSDLSGFEYRGAFGTDVSSCSEQQLKQIMRKVSHHFADTSLEFLWNNLLQKQPPVLLR